MSYENSRFTSESFKQAIGTTGIFISDLVAIGVAMYSPKISMLEAGAYILLTTIVGAGIISKFDDLPESKIESITKDIYNNQFS